MKPLESYINTSLNTVNEMLLGAMICGALIGYCAVQAPNKRDNGGGGFWAWMIEKTKTKSEDKKTKLEKQKADLEKQIQDQKDKQEIERLQKELDGLKSKKDEKDDNDNYTDKDIDKMAEALALAQKANEAETDETKKKENQEQLDNMSACLYDENGNRVPADKIAEHVSQTFTPEELESMNKASEGYKEQAKDVTDEKIKDEVSKVSKDDLKKLVDDNSKRAAEVCKKKKAAKEDKPKDDVKKDADGNVLKQETVTDPKTGEKKKVTTHTGPRGGKFYMSKKGTKVYVHEDLAEFLKSNLM